MVGIEEAEMSGVNGVRRAPQATRVRPVAPVRAPVRALALALAAAGLAACAAQGAHEAAVAPSAGPGGNGTAAATANLAGTWQLDPRQSGMGGRGAPMDAAYPGGYPGGMAGGGRFGGRPGFGADRRESRDSLARDSVARDSLMRAMGHLEIVQTDTTLTFTAGRAAPLTVFTDWRETRIPGRYGPGDVTFVTGSWKAGRFEVRRVLPSRTVVVESYEVSRDGKQLTVTTRIAERSEEQGELLPREGRRVYNKVTT